MQIYWPYIALVTGHIGFKGNFPCSNLPHTVTLTHPHLVLTVTAASHPPPTLTLSSRYVESLTVSTLAYVFFMLHCLLIFM